MSILQDSRRINLGCLMATCMMLEEREHAMPWMNQGLQCLDKVVGREVQAGDLRGKRPTAKKCSVHKGSQEDPTSREQDLDSTQGEGDEAFEPQGGRPDMMSATKGLSWQSMTEGATEEAGRDVCGEMRNTGREAREDQGHCLPMVTGSQRPRLSFPHRSHAGGPSWAREPAASFLLTSLWRRHVS